MSIVLKKKFGQNFLIDKNILHKISNLILFENSNIFESFQGVLGLPRPRGGWKRILLEKSLPKVGSRLGSVPWGPVSWPFSVFANFARSTTT